MTSEMMKILSNKEVIQVNQGIILIPFRRVIDHIVFFSAYKV